MKKTYIIPSVEIVKIEAASILASSVVSINDDVVNTSDPNVQFGREDRLSNPDVWSQGW